MGGKGTEQASLAWRYDRTAMEQELKMAKLAACKAGLAYVELPTTLNANSLTRQQLNQLDLRQAEM